MKRTHESLPPGFAPGYRIDREKENLPTSKYRPGGKSSLPCWTDQRGNFWLAGYPATWVPGYLATRLPRHPAPSHNSHFFVKFDNGQRKTPRTLPHDCVFTFFGDRIVPAVGDAVVGRCAEPQQGDQVVWDAGSIFWDYV